MPRIRFDFGSFSIEAEMLDTPTAKAIAKVLPYEAAAMTWGEEVYFDVPVRRLAPYVVERHADGNITVRPEAVFG